MRLNSELDSLIPWLKLLDGMYTIIKTAEQINMKLKRKILLKSKVKSRILIIASDYLIILLVQ